MRAYIVIKQSPHGEGDEIDSVFLNGDAADARAGVLDSGFVSVFEITPSLSTRSARRHEFCDCDSFEHNEHCPFTPFPRM